MAVALAGRVSAAPEQPFLFFRGERGHFRWWSAERSLERLRTDAGEAAPAGEPAATAWLRACEGRADPALAGALAEAIGPALGHPDVWISTRSEPEPLDAGLVRLLAASGGAVVWEPGPRLRAELLLWARPTLIDGSAAELVELLEAAVRSAPRFGALRWLRRRLARTRALIVTSGSEQEVGEAIAPLLAEAAPDILPFPRGRW